MNWRAPLLALAVTGAVTLGARAETLVVCTEASPDALNPQLTTSGTSADVAEQIYDQLVELRRGGSEIIPGLAESWTTSEDGLTVTFRLRPGVQFQSNTLFKPTRDMNADDVVFSFERMIDPNNPYHNVSGGVYAEFQGLLGDKLVAVTKADERTVQFHLSAPLAPLISMLSLDTFSVLSKEYADAMLKAGKPDELDQNPIGTGPFSFVRFQRDAEVRFRAFPGSWTKAAGIVDRTAKVDNLVFSITPDPSVRFAKLRTNECQVARYPSPADFAAMRAEKTIRLLSAPIADLSLLAFRTDKPPFDNIKVREALATAIDLDGLIAAVFQGTAKKTASLIPPTLWGHDASLQPRPYDPARAKQLLTEAGLSNGFNTTIWAIPVSRAYMPNGRRAAEMIQADWAKIGVRATIVSYEWGEYLRRVRAGEADVAEFGGTWDYPDPSQIPTNYLTCVGGRPRPNNAAHWCDPDYNAAIDQASRITDRAARQKLYIRADQIFAQQIPGVLLGNSAAFVAVREGVQDFKVHVFGGTPFFGVSLAR